MGELQGTAFLGWGAWAPSLLNQKQNRLQVNILISAEVCTVFKVLLAITKIKKKPPATALGNSIIRDPSA